MMSDVNPKKWAAERAVELIENGMTIGLGTGSTAYYAINRIAERVREGLQIQAVASSKSSEDLAVQWGIPIVPFSSIDTIHLTIDGADEVDDRFNLIKGGGGALLREKILAANSQTFIVIVDESKMVGTLGQFPLPVEIVPFASELTMNKLKALNFNPIIRKKDHADYITDNGNLIADCYLERIVNPEEAGSLLKSIPGVVEHGLFIQMASTVIVGNVDGTIRVLAR